MNRNLHQFWHSPDNLNVVKATDELRWHIDSASTKLGIH